MAAPNFILGVLDDAYDGALALMPEANALARSKGVRFVNSFTEYPLCSPSRATLFSGRAAHGHGVTGNLSFSVSQWERIFTRSVVKTLRDAGYRTCLIGVKALNGFEEGTPALIGFTDWHILDDHSADARYTNPVIDSNGVVTEHTGYSTDIFGELARDEIERAKADGIPLFLVIAFAAPHAPATPKPTDVGKFSAKTMPLAPNFNEADLSDKPFFVSSKPLFDANKIASVQQAWRDRGECNLSVSRQWAQIVRLVEDSGLAPTTYLHLTSDNGFNHGARRETGKGMAGYDEDTRVFSVWWGPGVRRGGVVNEYVSNVDTPATILDLAGLTEKHGAPIDGRSMRPLLISAEKAKIAWRTALVIVGFWGGTDDGESADPAKISTAVYTPKWRYCSHVGPGIIGQLEELYDLRPNKSPDGANARYQLTNVASRPAYADVLLQLRSLALSYRKTKGKSCFLTPSIKEPR